MLFTCIIYHKAEITARTLYSVKKCDLTLRVQTTSSTDVLSDLHACRNVILYLTFYFSSFNIVDWWHEGHPACRKSCTSNPQRFFFGEPSLTWSDLWKCRPVKCFAGPTIQQVRLFQACFSPVFSTVSLELVVTVLISDSLSVFKSRLNIFFIHSVFHWTLLRPAASASEVTTVWRFINCDCYYYYYLSVCMCRLSGCSV